MPANDALMRAIGALCGLAWLMTPWASLAQSQGVLRLESLLKPGLASAQTAALAATPNPNLANSGSTSNTLDPASSKAMGTELLAVYGAGTQLRVDVRHHDQTLRALVVGQDSEVGRLIEIDGLCAVFQAPGRARPKQRHCLDASALVAPPPSLENSTAEWAAPSGNSSSVPSISTLNVPLNVPLSGLSDAPAVQGTPVQTLPVVSAPVATSGNALAAPNPTPPVQGR